MRASADRARALGVAGTAMGLGCLAGVPAGPAGMLAAAATAAGVVAVAWWRADRHVLAAMRAYPVAETEQPRLYRAVRELCAAARLPVPRIYVSPTAAPTALSVGRGARRASLVCSEGLLVLLDDRELRAVVAHELAHVRRGETLAPGLAAVLAGGVLMLAGLAVLVSDDDHDGSAGSGAGGALGGLLLLLLAPAAALLLRLGVCREREYAADAEAARLTGDPMALARALRAVDARARALPLPAHRRLLACGHLMTTHPFRPVGLARLLRSHPPVGQRVARLEALAGYPR